MCRDALWEGQAHAKLQAGRLLCAPPRPSPCPAPSLLLPHPVPAPRHISTPPEFPGHCFPLSPRALSGSEGAVNTTQEARLAACPLLGRQEGTRAKPRPTALHGAPPLGDGWSRRCLSETGDGG